MLLIYNLSGLLVGLAGLACGFAALLATGSVGAGLCGVAAAWFGLGLWWRRRPVGDPGDGRPTRAWPALFFVPLPFLAVPLFVLGVAGVLVQRNRDARPPDPPGRGVPGRRGPAGRRPRDRRRGPLPTGARRPAGRDRRGRGGRRL